MRISTRVRVLLDLLERAQWASHTWSADYPTCPYCFELQEDAGELITDTGLHKQRGHRADCEWLTTMITWGRI